MEFTWYPYWKLDKGTNSIFTYIANDHYNINDRIFNKFISDKDLLLKNKPNEAIDLEAKNALEYFQELSNSYRTNNILFFYGDDFSFQHAHANFINIEFMMDYMNNNPNFNDKIELFYSTPSKYFKIVTNDTYLFPSYKDLDFFPYSNQQKSYWTGFYTTRPYLKGLVRDAGIYLSNTSKLVLNYILVNLIEK